MKSFMKTRSLIHILLSLIISFSIIFYPVVEHASISDKMEQVFNALSFRVTTTHPGIYESQKVGILTGGSIVMRNAGGLNPPLFSIKPPQINAGCGGIDIFFGAFQYVNKEQLVNMLKNIGAAAVGYAFKLGLEAVCPTCNQVLSDLANFANQLSQLATNSCAMGQLIAQGIFGTPGRAAEAGKGGCRLQYTSETEDTTEAEKECEGPNFLEKIAQEAHEWLSDINNQLQKLPLMSGVLPGSTVESVGRKLGFPTDDIIIMRSFVGDILIKGKIESSGEVKEVPTPQFIKPTINLSELMYGNPDAEFLVYYESSNTVAYEKRNLLPAGGMKVKVYNLLNQINDKIKSGTALTDDEKKFVANCPFPIVNLLTDANKVPELSNAIIEVISDTVAVMYAYSLAEYYVRTVLMNVSNQPNVPINEAVQYFDQRKQELFAELQKELDVLSGQYAALSLSAFYIKEIRRNITSLLKDKNA